MDNSAELLAIAEAIGDLQRTNPSRTPAQPGGSMVEIYQPPFDRNELDWTVNRPIVIERPIIGWEHYKGSVEAICTPYDSRGMQRIESYLVIDGVVVHTDASYYQEELTKTQLFERLKNVNNPTGFVSRVLRQCPNLDYNEISTLVSSISETLDISVNTPEMEAFFPSDGSVVVVDDDPPEYRRLLLARLKELGADGYPYFSGIAARLSKLLESEEVRNT